jgi:hypothetical protein
LGFLDSLAAPTDLVLDYLEPPGQMPPKSMVARQIRVDMLTGAGEPWTSFFTPQDVAAMLRAARLPEIEDLDMAQLVGRYLDEQPESDAVYIDSQRIVHASRRGS